MKLMLLYAITTKLQDHRLYEIEKEQELRLLIIDCLDALKVINSLIQFETSISGYQLDALTYRKGNEAYEKCITVYQEMN